MQSFAELRAWLILNNIPKYFYTFNEPLDGESVGIVYEKGSWVVFGCERGQRVGETIHSLEAVAVMRFLEKLRELLNSYGHPWPR